MIITVIGINHKTAPIEIREKFYLNETQQELLLSELKIQPKVIEAFVLSTCNRTEVYLHTISDVKKECVIQLIDSIKSLPSQQSLTGHFYKYLDNRAVKHLFQVVCGLDSLVLGEKQILGQVKNALEKGKQKGFFLKPFNILSNLVINTGKKVRNETALGCGGSSISWAAITKAKNKLGVLSEVKTLVIGAGKMSKLAVGQMVSKGFKKLYLMNRTHENAQALALQFNGQAVPFADIKEILSEVDFCICSSSAPHHILDAETVERIMPFRKQKPLLFIDISMPRNIDPKINQIEGVTLYSIDDLDSVLQNNMQKRKKALKEVELIIEEKLSAYHHKISKLDAQHLPILSN